jgi:hypothetical protein
MVHDEKLLRFAKPGEFLARWGKKYIPLSFETLAPEQMLDTMRSYIERTFGITALECPNDR